MVVVVAAAGALNGCGQQELISYEEVLTTQWDLPMGGGGGGGGGGRREWDGHEAHPLHPPMWVQAQGETRLPGQEPARAPVFCHGGRGGGGGGGGDGAVAVLVISIRDYHVWASYTYGGCWQKRSKERKSSGARDFTIYTVGGPCR